MSDGQVKNSVQVYLTIYIGQVIWQQDKWKFDLTWPGDKWKILDFFTPVQTSESYGLSFRFYSYIIKCRP